MFIHIEALMLLLEKALNPIFIFNENPFLKNYNNKNNGFKNFIYKNRQRITR